MPRRVEISWPSEGADALVAELRRIDGVLGVAIQRGGSVDPPGDVVTVSCTNDAHEQVLRVYERERPEGRASYSVSKLRAFVPSRDAVRVQSEPSQLTWEEGASLLRRETNVTTNYVALMFLTGVIAAAGLWADAAVIVAGAMVLAPGFEPLVRMPYGFLAGPRRHALEGLRATAAGYGALVVGAALTALALRFADPAGAAAFETRYWVGFWSTITPPGVAIALVGGIAGVVTILADRPVQTAGVMIALALIPSIAIGGMGLVLLEPDLALRGLGRWSVDVVGVVALGAAALAVQHRVVHRRRALG